ncbi:MAG: hypothetical protein J7639_29150, partial [Paenibacillaceae bacterium]|nr:hypothetical protein [Paenibacillaceae bacterium]
KRWYTEYLGVDVNESGNLTTRSGLEIHLCKSAVPGQTLNFVGQNLNHSTSRGEEPSMSIVNIVVDGLDDMHRRMMEDGQDVMDFIFYRGSCGRFFQLADPDGNKLEIWERQTVLYRKDPEPGSNGTSVYMYHDYGMHVTQEGYFEEVLKSTQGRIRTVYIGAYEKVLAEDPEGLHTQLERLRAFNVQYPAYALRAIYRNGNTFFRLF